MKSLSLALVLSLCFCTAIFAQNSYSVKGVIADTANNSKLHNATISILNAKDSILVKYSRASATGAFSITPLKKGNFLMMITYPEYADYVIPFSLDSAKREIDFKQINMKTKARLLNEVIIKGQAAAIKIKGDTTEFNAASYTIQPNDKVEDLLKKFPGMQIDKDGKITAQGKTVSKVLVDGEEFFGDDPTLATKNLRADMVDKVQLFDKSSDQAAFTGVDDGQKTTTLNIKLKEDKKNGYFGKVDGGIATDDFYEGQVMFNKFKAKQKFSAYGIMSNTGKIGLGWEDRGKYGASGSDNVEFIDGGMYISSGGDDLDSYGGGYYGEGIPIARTGGAHYDTKFNDDKQTINTNYKIGSLGVKGTKNILNQNNLIDGIINSNTNQLTDNYVFRQKLDVTYQIKLDTTSNLKIMVDGTLKNNTTKSDYQTAARREDNSLLNTSTRTVDNDGDESAFNMSAFYTKKLKKLGRNYSVNVSGKINEVNNEGFLKSDNEVFNADGTPKSSKIVDQFKTNETKSSIFSTNFTYNEPVTKSLALVLNYGFSLNNSTADKKSFNTSTPGRYDVLDTQFSNDFEANQYINQGGAVLNYKKNKTIITAGTKLSAVKFDQFEAYTNAKYNRSFLNWIPQASYQYKFSAQKSLRFNYNGYTNQPSVEQLQPVRVNTDDFNIPEGNPDLKPSYNSNFSINYNSYKILTSRGIYLNGRFGFTNNQIVNNVTTDVDGRSIIKAVNLTDKTPINYSAYIDYNRKIKGLDINGGLSLNIYGRTNYNYVTSIVNGAPLTKLNTSTSVSYSANLSLYKSKEKKYDFQLYGGPSYNQQKSSLQPDVNNNGYSFYGSGSFTIFLPGKVQLKSDANFEYTGKTQSFNEDFTQLILNSSIVKSFFKSENLKLSIKGNDLLNQNRGFSRYANANNITQTSYTTIKRYFMFSATWDFSKMAGIKK
ncbi:outer membrane beta-barrel protein [Pedobacter boryungensis]|uniref:TonB-dependent receptor n=1 Tax=Pedobacter boryungensis TaxID=869962 RepID=A0ABX2DCM8_9SPHI|nr:outer membrane beta-barrel protein [Pedobacter boryungensis]NQX31820.1 TonB-dependent receptor [Pedobacter boryungensis]